MFPTASRNLQRYKKYRQLLYSYVTNGVNEYKIDTFTFGFLVIFHCRDEFLETVRAIHRQSAGGEIPAEGGSELRKHAPGSIAIELLRKPGRHDHSH